MSIQDQFLGEDSQSSKSLAEDGRNAFDARVVIKRTTAYTGTSQDKGVAQSRTTNLIETGAGMRLMTGKDIIDGSGLYALGDIEVTTSLPVFGADTVNGIQADKLIWEGREYTMQGRPYRVPLAGGTSFCRSVWRQA